MKVGKSKIVLADVRDDMNYTYQRSTQEGKYFSMLEVDGCEFGSLYLPANIANAYKKLFAKDQYVFSIKVSKAAYEPVSYNANGNPIFPEGVKPKTQQILLDGDSIAELVEVLPAFVEDVIPGLKEQAQGGVTEQLSEYSTFSVAPQVRARAVLKEFVNAKDRTALTAGVVQFPKSYSLHLSYPFDANYGFSVYINEVMRAWLLLEAPAILRAVERLRTGSTWNALLLDPPMREGDSSKRRRAELVSADGEDPTGDNMPGEMSIG